MLARFGGMRKIHDRARALWTKRAQHDTIGKAVDEVDMCREALRAVVEVEDELARQQLVGGEEHLFDFGREKLFWLRDEEFLKPLDELNSPGRKSRAAGEVALFGCRFVGVLPTAFGRRHGQGKGSSKQHGLIAR